MKTQLLTILILITVAFNATAQIHFGTVTKVSDGDTITVATKAGSLRVRLAGIDAPETTQPYGPQATTYLQKLIGGKKVTIRATGQDRYGRTIGIVTLGSMDVNQHMILTGHAWWYEHFDPDNWSYQNAQHTAKSNRTGLWAFENPIPPWNWRKSNR